MAALDELSADDWGNASADLLIHAAKAAVENADPAKQKDVAEAAVDALDADARTKFVNSLIPQQSADRKAVYLAGFAAATVLAIVLALIGWGAADSGNEGVGTAAITAAVSLPSAIIGGLLGAYATR